MSPHLYDGPDVIRYSVNRMQRALPHDTRSQSGVCRRVRTGIYTVAHMFVHYSESGRRVETNATNDKQNNYKKRARRKQVEGCERLKAPQKPG